jgi:hypothetical protein
LKDVASAHDLLLANAPMNIYSESQMTRIMRESKQFKKETKGGSFKKILDDIQKRSVD